MKVNTNNNKQTFGALHIDGKAKSLLFKRITDPKTYYMVECLKTKLENIKADVHLTATDSFSHERFQASIYNELGQLKETYTESYLSRLFFGPQKFLKKILEKANNL